jgi:hypothetical protein
MKITKKNIEDIENNINLKPVELIEKFNINMPTRRIYDLKKVIRSNKKKILNDLIKEKISLRKAYEMCSKKGIRKEKEKKLKVLNDLLTGEKISEPMKTCFDDFLIQVQKELGAQWKFTSKKAVVKNLESIIQIIN